MAGRITLFLALPLWPVVLSWACLGWPLRRASDWRHRKVVTRLQAIETGQVQTSGSAAMSRQMKATPFVVRAKLDDDKLAARLPAGAAGSGAVFTDHVEPAHIIRKLLLRQTAILNYVLPL